MRKWSPEVFSATLDPPAPVFEEWEDSHDRADRRAEFREAAGDHVPVEVADPVEEIRKEIQDRFNARSATMESEYTRRLEEARREYVESLAAWRDNWMDLQERRYRRLAEDATDLALMVAEKVIRRQSTHDRDMLLGTLETALFKIQAESEVTVLVHPDDAFWLEMDEEIRTRLRIGAVVPDRRVDQGGCRIKTGGQEWDATVKTQLDTLAELLDGGLMDPEDPEDPHGQD